MMKSESTLCSCVYTNTHTHTPSSLQSICHLRLPSLMTVLSLFHHFCLSGMSFFISVGFIWFSGHSARLHPLFYVTPPQSTTCLFFLLLFISSHSCTLHYLSRLNLPKLQMCRGKKNKMGRALIPGIWDSPFWPGQNEPRSVWFGQCYSCLSKWPQAPSRFEEKSTQTQAGTGLNLTTIFESFLPSKSFWFKHTHTHMHPVCLYKAWGRATSVTNGSTGNAKPATSEC